MRRHSVLSLILVLLLLLAACDLQQGSTQPNTNTPLPPTPTTGATPAPQLTPDLTAPITATLTTRTIIIWLPPEIATRTTLGADTLLDQIAEVAANLPDVEIRIEQKAVSGQGGMLSYLRTGRIVAPDILPDLIVLPTEQLVSSFNDSLIYPLDGLLEEEMLDALYPAARAMAQPDTQIMGYPFALTGLGHLAYTPGALGDAPILTWDDFLALAEQSLIIAGSGRPGAVLALQMYLDAGGTLTNEAGQPTLQVTPLTLALEQIAAGRASGFILNQSSSAVSVAETWQLFVEGASTIVQTTSDQILLSQSADLSPDFAPFPGINGHLVPIVNGWAWAISTSEVAQQELAVEVMLGLINDTRLATWSFQSGILPAQQAAFSLWPQENAYVSFLGEELARARPFPSPANNTIMGILGNAVVDVLSQTKTPQLAAEEASATLQP